MVTCFFLLPQIFEKLTQNVCTFALEHSASYLGLVIVRQCEQVNYRPAGACLGVVCPENDTGEP